MHGKKVRQIATYKKVLEHIIVKIQSTFYSPINIVKSIRNMKEMSPNTTEPKWTRVKILKDDTAEIIDENKFLQYT